jgi:hypothetical protein
MRKLKVFGAVLAAVFAVGVVVVSSASAVTFLLAGFLEAGGTSWNEEEVNTTGELVFEDNKAPIVGRVAIKCSGTLMGLILGRAEPSHVMIESVLDLSGNAISSTQLSGTSLSCANVANCGTAEVWPAHLPWLGEIELMIEGSEEFFAILLSSGGNGNPGGEIKCPLLTDECTAETGIAKLENLTGGVVDAIFGEEFTLLAELPLATCSASGAASGVVAGEGTTTTALGGALTVSSLE